MGATPKTFHFPAKFDGETVVYLAYADDNRLLYVGIANNFYKRMAQHAQKSRWWMEVDHFKVEPYATRHRAMVREKNLIRSRHPSYNEQHQDEPNLQRVRKLKEKFTGPACKHCDEHHLPEGEDVCADCRWFRTSEFAADMRAREAMNARYRGEIDTYTMTQIVAMRKAKAARKAPQFGAS